MLKLSKKTDYAIILLCHLGDVDAPVSAQEIAGNYQLPQPMVANILKQLGAAGLIFWPETQSQFHFLTSSASPTILLTWWNVLMMRNFAKFINAAQPGSLW